MTIATKKLKLRVTIPDGRLGEVIKTTRHMDGNSPNMAMLDVHHVRLDGTGKVVTAEARDCKPTVS